MDSVDAHDGTTPCKGHAGSAIFPALFAFADGRDITGVDFATLLTVGYEIAYHAGFGAARDMRRLPYIWCMDNSWRGYPLPKALGCGMETIRQAAGITEYHGARSQMMRCIDHPTMVRDGVGWGTPSGVTAAYLAQAGFTGAPALTYEQTPTFWDDLGTNWRLVSDTYYKPYPYCRWAHPSIDAAAVLMRDHELHHSEVAGVDIKTFHHATHLAGQTPQTPDEFAYAIVFPVATMIVRSKSG